MSQDDDGMVKLERAHDPHRELPLSQVIDAEEQLPGLDRNKIMYLIDETNVLEHRPVYLTTSTNL